MREMLNGTVIPDLQKRAGLSAVIRSRVLRTWGHTESGLAEMLADRIKELDAPGNPTLAFQASGIEGIKVRITAKAGNAEEAEGILADEEARVRAILGDVIFGVDNQTMESAIIDMLRERGLSLGIAESLTGGLMGARITSVPGASDVFRGSIVSYASDVKFSLLSVPEGPVVTADAAKAMAEGARKTLAADVALATTGVAGPAEQEGQPVGTVFIGLAMDGKSEAQQVKLPGDRQRIRQYAVISAFDLLRKRLTQ
jgi:nicotinamide-nucleotide amidase